MTLHLAQDLKHGAITITTCTWDTIRLREFPDYQAASEALAWWWRVGLAKKSIGQLRVDGVISLESEFRFLPATAHIVTLNWHAGTPDNPGPEFRVAKFACEHWPESV